MIRTYSGRKETWQTHNLKDKLQDDVVVNPTKNVLQNKIECLRSITRFPSILRERSPPPERSHRNYNCHKTTQKSTVQFTPCMSPLNNICVIEYYRSISNSEKCYRCALLTVCGKINVRTTKSIWAKKSLVVNKK